MLAQLSDLWELIRVSLEGLLANKLRSALTMLGVIIGVGAVIALMSIGAGVQEDITGEISSMGSNLLSISAGGMQRVGGGSSNTGWITDDDYEAIVEAEVVSDPNNIVPTYNVSGQIIAGETNFSATAIGTTDDYLELYELNVEFGDFINEGDIDKREKVVVLGSSVAEELYGDFNPIGQKITFVDPGTGQKTKLKVIGVLEEEGDSMLMSTDDSIFVPISTAQTRLANARNTFGDLTLSSITIMADSEETVDATLALTEEVLREEHDLSEGDDDDFNVTNQADMLSTVTAVTDTLTIFLGAIAGISLLVGGIGIMNIMLVSVTERTREIGLRKAIGARRSDILIQFLLEAVILSLLGGTLGILLGVGLSQIVNMTGLITSVVSIDSIALAVGFSFAIGLFFGIYPANQAAKLSPIEALRYE